MPKMARAVSVRPAPTRPQIPTTSPLAGLEADVVQDALAADPLHAETDLTDGTVALGELLLQIVSDHAADEIARW